MFYAACLQIGFCAATFLDNSIQKQNILPLPCYGLLYPYPVEAEPQTLEGNGFQPGFRGWELKRGVVERLNILGSFLAKKRHELGLSQEITAARLQRAGVDVSRQMLANMECGRTQITDKHLVGFQKVFRICIIRLFPVDVQVLDEHFAQRKKDQLDGPRRRRQ